MSQLLNYVKNLLQPPFRDRKRRRTELQGEVAPQLPKYRRVSSVFPKQYNGDDEVDPYTYVKRNRQNYNDILENFLMEQHNQNRKHYQAINDDEFSDEDDINVIRAPTASVSRPPAPSSSGFPFKYSQPSTSSRNFNFSQQRQRSQNENGQFQSKQTSPVQKSMPPLVPIARSVQTQHMSNGMGPSNGGYSSSSHNRRSVLDFTNKNRAFSNNSSSAFKPPASILDRNHNLEVKNRYDSLLKALIPRFAQKSQPKYSNSSHKQVPPQPIETVDLSSDETEFTSAMTSAQANRFPQLRQKNTFDFKKPSPTAFTDLSDDDSEGPSFLSRTPVMSSTIIQNKQAERSARSESSSANTSIPEVKSVNSLKERQQTRPCMKDDAIQEIIRKFEESRCRNSKQIEDANKEITQLSTETHQEEKFHQQRIDATVTSLKQCIIVDEEEPKEDEFPPLTDQQLQVVRFGLYGNRNETIVSKFNMNITRNDLTTLDGLNWLNDEVINFYMELLKDRSLENEFLPKVHVMNTFFIPKLLSSGHSGVKRWTRKVDIFKFDIIPVPVHVGGVHWCMSVINIRDKTIKYYDSMGHPNMPVLEALEDYLQKESLDKKQEVYDTSDWRIECVRDCPQQRNGSDCGVFSCMFAEFITRDSDITFDQQHMPYFRRKMVYEIATGKLILGN